VPQPRGSHLSSNLQLSCACSPSESSYCSARNGYLRSVLSLATCSGSDKTRTLATTAPGSGAHAEMVCPQTSVYIPLRLINSSNSSSLYRLVPQFHDRAIRRCHEANWPPAAQCRSFRSTDAQYLRSRTACNANTFPVEGIWDAFAESNFWFGNLNWMPLVFLKPSSQVNNFTVIFHFFMGMSKSVFSICLG
jgi:hypothetical protein